MVWYYGKNLDDTKPDRCEWNAPNLQTNYLLGYIYVNLVMAQKSYPFTMCSLEVWTPNDTGLLVKAQDRKSVV